MSRVDAVLLDAGGVLLLPDASVLLEELSRVGLEVDPARFARGHYAGMRATDLDHSESFSWWPYNHAFVDELGVATTDVEAARAAVDRAYAAMEWNVVIDEAIEALSSLHDLVPHVAVVSNSDGTVERLLRSLGVIGERVETVIDSHVAGVAKPDPRIFELAIEELGVDASNVMHVGDSVRFDVAGARAAGLRAVHLDPLGLCTDDDHEHVSSLAGAVDLI